MSDLSIKKERVLAAAKKCPQSKKVLEELFPEVFEPEDNDHIFCFGNDIFVRKNSSGILGFRAGKEEGCIHIVNIIDDKPWSTSIPKNQVKCGYPLRAIAITRGDMRRLLKGVSAKLEDVYVIQRDDIEELKLKINKTGA